MARLTPHLAATVYLALLLAAAAAMNPGLAGTSGLPYAVLAILLLAAHVYAAIRPQRPEFKAVLNVLLIFLAPLVLLPVSDGLGVGAASPPVAVALALPSLLLLDDSLREYARSRQVFTESKSKRHVTPTFISLAFAAMAVMALGLVVGRTVLLPAGAALLAYLIIVAVGVLMSVPRSPFDADTVLKRVIAGTQGSLSVDITSRASRDLYCHLTPGEAWVRVRPTKFVFSRGCSARLELSFTPALAGEFQPRLRLSALDRRGLVQIDQSIEPLHLHVIPMARYAGWLARKYLEQVEAGVVPGARPPLEQLQALKRGIEYQESRAYQPGDPLKDIDWKHTAKLNQLIVNTYGESGQQAAIIAANLEAGSAAESDRLAFNLITVALTLARENIPAALAVYDRRRVIQNTGILDNLEMLKQALSLARQISTEEGEGRHLEPTDIARVRRNIRQLQQAESGPARRLLEILSFERRAVEEVARNHPATLALSAAASRVPAPATIFLVSMLNHDAEAILVASERLARRNFTIIPVE